MKSQMDRLNEIEVSTSPKEWTIQLLDDMRQYPTEKDFWESVAKADFENCLLFKPLSMLRKQAEARYPGQGRQAKEACAQLRQQLQIQFQQLKILIGRINEVVLKKTDIALQADSILRAQLQDLVRESRLQSVADGIKTCLRRTGQDRPEFANVRWLLKRFYDDDPPTSASMIKSGAVLLAETLKTLLEHEAGVKMLQDRYFDGHPVLFRDIEDALNQRINSAKETSMLFRFCFSGRQRARFRQVKRKFGAIDVVQLEKQARMSATWDVLELNGTNLEDRWLVFRAMSKPQLSGSLGPLILD